jgi:beta-lactamase class A
MTTLERRAFTLGMLTSLAAACTRGGAKAPLHEDAERQLVELERKVGGRVGVLAVDTGSGARIARRSSERFAMCSTFKIVLVAAVLSRVELGELSLDERVPFSAAALIEHADVTTAHVAEGAMALGDLCDAAIEVSDNTATNLLLPKVGGPAGLTSYARGLGDAVTRFDRNELSLNLNLPGDPRDTSTPEAFLATMQKILLGDALGPASRERILAAMKRSHTGDRRLRAGLPGDWVFAGKTGTGGRCTFNHVGVVWPPARRPILIVSYLSETEACWRDILEGAHATIGGVLAAAFARA